MPSDGVDTDAHPPELEVVDVATDDASEASKVGEGVVVSKFVNPER